VGFDVGGYELGLHPASETQRPGVGGDRAYWGVDDCRAAIDRLVALGATVLEPAQDVGGGILIGAVRDPSGNALGVVENPHFQTGVVTVVGPGDRLGAAPGDVSDRAIVHEVMLAASPAEVWRLWTTSEGLSRWLADRAQVELRIGGPYEIYFLDDAPPGSQGSEGCKVLSWLPERMLSFTWNAPPMLSTTRHQHTWVVLELEPVGEGTRIRITHLGWPESGLADQASEWPATFAYFARAWRRVLEALQAEVGAP
jgi:uncharacterized protein YndB with AHSA1/START domain